MKHKLSHDYLKFLPLTNLMQSSVLRNAKGIFNHKFIILKGRSARVRLKHKIIKEITNKQ